MTATLVGDTFTIYSSPNANKGKVATLEVAGPPALRNTYVKFDLNPLPAGITGSDVAKATLTLFANKVITGGSFDVLQLTSGWDELLVTWDNGPLLGTTVSSVAIDLADKNTFKAFDVTAAVKAWVDAPLTNNGLLLVDLFDGLNVKFDSKENGSKSHPPQLEITLAATSATIVDGSVGNADLANNAVTSAKIADASVGNADLGGDAVTSNKILDGSITGADVADGSLRNADINFSPLTAGQYNTGVGESALQSIGSGIGSSNTATGYHALTSTINGFFNTATGARALASNIYGTSNTATGADALGLNDGGDDNTAVGNAALGGNVVGSANTAIGRSALENNSTSYNTAVGFNALTSSTSGGENIAVGANATDALTTGSNNTAIGTGAFGNLTAGTGNIAVGWHGGLSATTNDNDIYIGSTGAAAENNTIRIGNTSHTKTFIRGIYGQTTANTAIPVLVDSFTGQLGTVSSSRRFKIDIHDMKQASSALLKLRPVTFKYKPNLDPSGTTQYGLIAEEVEQVMPDLVVYDKDGKPETVKYHILASLLLNELQKQYRTQQAQQKTLAAQQAELRSVHAENTALRAAVDEIQVLKARLAALEAGSVVAAK
ncbi:MAG: DNRLRE domain-containing protein [Deltaproteobacteria bacterium]|nr:DNRLRE domain-containing protein [Deltaproteobacteria bacterium]